MDDSSGWLARFGYLAIAAVVAGMLMAGLPADAWRRGMVITLLALAVTGWLAALSRRWAGRRYAIIVVVTGLAGAGLQLAQPNGPAFVIGYMALAALALRLPRRAALTAAAVVLAAIAYAQVVTSTRPVTAALGVALGAGFVFAAGSLAAANRQARQAAEALLAQQEATRAASEQAAALAERARLARELHDVLAHALSGLAVQLEGARLLAQSSGTDPRLVQQLTQAHSLARDGIGNAKRAVSALRGEPPPGPGMLAQLVDQVRSQAGLPVTLTVTGTAHPLLPEAGLAIYRTVQEALTNIGKYAGRDACATVALSWSANDVQVEIVDAVDPHRSPHPRMSNPDPSTTEDGSGVVGSGGFGLSGLAERAALLGGSLTAGPVQDGFRVHLRLPLHGFEEGSTHDPGTGRR